MNTRAKLMQASTPDYLQGKTKKEELRKKKTQEGGKNAVMVTFTKTFNVVCS